LRTCARYWNFVALNLTVIAQEGTDTPAPDMAENDPDRNTDGVLETTLDVVPDMAVIGPSVSPPAEAILCACAVAEATKAGSEHDCDCANCCEICVPAMLNDSVIPLFSLATFCCRVVRLATVAFVFVRGVVRLKVHCSMGPASSKLMAYGFEEETFDKFAAVIPDPCKAASTSSRPVLTPA